MSFYSDNAALVCIYTVCGISPLRDVTAIKMMINLLH